MEKEFVYSLRIGICPDFYSEEKFRDIVEFCKAANIDDVQFFINMEEVNQGHLTKEETKVWLNMLSEFKPRLEKEGITVSMNPWTTLLHGDRGRTLKDGQDFTLMTDVEGNKSAATPCPLDEKFHAYIKEIYGMYAELGFSVIWIEDDFRLHNHSPLEWGGCFCEIHRKEFAKRIGKEVAIDEFLEGVLKPGEPHPYRKVWLDTARDTMNKFSEVLGNAVHDVNPDIRVALMSSAPQSHCIEGRDWKQVFANLSGKNRPLNRPHLPAYGEETGMSYALNFQRFSRLTAAIMKGKVELWPELENLPHTTFSKSHKFAALEIESTLSLCAEGITINIFDMIGNGINKAQHNEEILKPIKAYLSGVKSLGMKPDQEQGVCVLYSTNSSYTLHTSNGKSMTELRPWETFWAEYLSAFGIASRYTDDYKVKGEIVAVSGQYFRNLEKSEIEELFKNNVVLLEGEAAATLMDMGLGHLAGIKSAQWCKMNTAVHSYEQAAKGTFYQNLPEARISAQGMSEKIDYLNITYNDPDVRTLSEMKSPKGETVGKGVTAADHVIIFPYGPIHGSYEFLLNPIRQEMLQQLFREVKEVHLPTEILDCEYVTVNEFVQDERKLLLVTNYSTDDVKNIKVVLSDEVKEVYQVSRETGEIVPTEWKQEENTLELLAGVEHLKSQCFILK